MPHRFGFPAIALSAVGLALSSTPAHADEPTLIWADEFSGSVIADHWTRQIGTGQFGWGNNELQYYTDFSQNAFQLNGVLHIVARDQNFGGSGYTSARLTTAGAFSFRYGRIEARMKLPSTKGIWPALWLFPENSEYGGWAASGEIDIMESVNQADSIYGTIHFGGSWPRNQNRGVSTTDGETDYSEDFHIYAMEWTPDVMRWYLDGELYLTLDRRLWFTENATDNPRAPFDQDFHFIVNCAVGGNFPGNPDATSQFPQEFLIDYIRVYELPQLAFTDDNQPHPIPGRIEAEDVDEGIPGEAFFDTTIENQGGAYRPFLDVDVENSTEGGFNVGYIRPGEWAEYTANVAQAGTYTVRARVASQGTGGTFHLEIDGADVTGPMLVPTTGGWQTWQTIATTAELPAGEVVIRWVNDSTLATQQYNLNWFDFEFLSVGCDADWNSDSSVDVFDILAFLDEWNAGLDYNNSGTSDIFDLLEFLSVWQDGCP